MARPFDPLDRLRDLVDAVAQAPHQKRFDHSGPNLRDSSPLSRLEHFRAALLTGALPDAETLLFVTLAINRYLSLEAESLDKAFGLRAIKRAGNPAVQRVRENRKLGLLFHMAMLREENPRMTIYEAAEAALADDDSHDKIKFEVETLQREYTRDGRGKVFEEALKATPKAKEQISK